MALCQHSLKMAKPCSTPLPEVEAEKPSLQGIVTAIAADCKVMQIDATKVICRGLHGIVTAFPEDGKVVQRYFARS